MNIAARCLSLLPFGCLLFFQVAQAVIPPPDGGYPGGNTAEGQNALFSLTSGGYNTAVGFFSLRNDTTGGFNTGFGAGALFSNNADQNSAFGALALFSNAGPGNSAFGYGALASNTANANAAFGAYALLSNTSGNFNTANGFAALQNNTTGVQNTATGSGSLFSNTTGANNTAAGVNALFNNTEGSTNSAFGWGALTANTIQDFSTAIGYKALFSNTAGGGTAVGSGALENNTTGIGNTATGSDALFSNTTGGHNTAIGEIAGYYLTTGSGNVCIGAGVSGVAGENNTIRIADNLPNGPGQSACYIGGIAGQAVDPSGAGQVYIDNSGKLGVFLSSQRYKRDIEPMDRASEAILALKPVSFHYKNDVTNTPCFGLIAEEAVKVDPALVLRDKEGKPYSVRYDQVNAMLLNEFLKEHRKVQKLEAALEAVNARLERQEADLRKVRAVVGVGEAASHLASRD